MNDALSTLLQLLNEQGIRYFAVGSVASSIHGLPRFTHDVDLVVEIAEVQLDAIGHGLRDEFYLDIDEARRSVRASRAFNLIHLATASKIDIFPLRSNDFHRSELARSAFQEWVIPGEGTVRLPVASAEDTILSKLAWYRDGGCVSDRQWSDVLGILAGKPRDVSYLKEWAARLGVADLLERLIEEAGQIRPE